MSFDKETRKLLAKTVAACRRRLTEDVTDQLSGVFGLHPDGTVLPLEDLTHLSPDQAAAARRLRDLLDHYTAGAAGGELNRRKTAYERMVLEISFTILNRLAALRLCEERGLVVECVRKGTASDGFRLFERIAGGALGGRYDTYRIFLECLFDELALDLGVLFDRLTPQAIVFPSERCMEDVLAELNKPELARLWSEDETIGWIYQYFNPAEERKAMREASQAPRNSRELAVRNQFFTPRYVVEFLTDNTLGRIWYEMRRGDTALKEECRYLMRRPNEVFLAPGEKPPSGTEDGSDIPPEELLKQPARIEHRPKKDPRDLQVLDPACGSGHFLIYAFDLLERIYEEAWADPGIPASEITGRALREEFETLADLCREIPRLIIEHNLHGIDIDPRAGQIAELALWLRAQKTWKNLGLKAAERPRIRRSNIVTAEPMPGEEDMRRELIEALRPKVLGQLTDVVFDKMKLAGEAGSLLKIEEEIRDAVAEAKKQWLEGPKPEQMLLFPESAERKIEQQQLRYDLAGVTDERFWEQAEDRILEALEHYAERAGNDRASRRRLFAEDAARGFAFIDLCRKRYDVVLMNPPFMEPPVSLEGYLQEHYPKSWTNFYASFFERALGRSHERVGTVLSDGFLSAYRLVGLRQDILTKGRLNYFSELGSDVFDGMALPTCAVVVSRKREALPIYVELNSQGLKQITPVPLASLRHLPNAVLTKEAIFGDTKIWQATPLDPSAASVTKGNTTFDDERFVRAWWEVAPSFIGMRWCAFEKGGEYQPFWGSTVCVLDFADEGRQIRYHGIARVGTDAQVMQSSRLWGRKGLVAPEVAGPRFGPRIMPEGTIFNASSIAIIPKHGASPYALLAILNSSQIRDFLLQQGAGLHVGTARVRHLPIAEMVRKERFDNVEDLGRLTANTWLELETYNETGRLFRGFKDLCWELINKAKVIPHEIDVAVDDLFRNRIIDGNVLRNDSLSTAAIAGILGGEPSKTLEVSARISYAVGVAVGRWDIRMALDPSLAPKLPEAFDPLPVCPPGMLVGPDGLPTKPGGVVSEEWLRARPDANTLPPEGTVSRPTIPDSKYPLRINWDGILADDPGFNGNQPHRDDIVRRVREVFDLLWKDKAYEIEQEACGILGVRDLRDWFRKPSGFFQDHLKRYSKSRRKAPIYWPLSTASGSYTIWIYYHRLTDQTLYAAVNKYVEPKISEVERAAVRIEEELKSALGRDAARVTDRLNETRALIDELRDLRGELLRIAALPYRPDLNDGVIINAAPLHNLLRLRSWAEETEKVWKKLEKGDYDWAHMAYTIWPDRVREVCRRDRSIAIAHGLEDICEVEPPALKKKGGRGRRRKEAPDEGESHEK